MKKFMEPEVEIVELDVEDVITVSEDDFEIPGVGENQTPWG